MSSPERPVWCPRCQSHLALAYLRYCPVCLDDIERTRARKDQK